MGIPRSHIQERLHEAYVGAVVAIAGLDLQWHDKREYGIDCHMQDVKPLVNGGMTESGPHLEFQLRSTYRAKMSQGKIIYDMNAKDYDKLVNVDGRLLILYCLPVNMDDWVNVNIDNLILRKCCYWSFLTGPSQNKSKKRVYIPDNQLFIPSCLRDLLRKLALGEFNHENNSK